MLLITCHKKSAVPRHIRLLHRLVFAFDPPERKAEFGLAVDNGDVMRWLSNDIAHGRLLVDTKQINEIRSFLILAVLIVIHPSINHLTSYSVLLNRSHVLRLSCLRDRWYNDIFGTLTAVAGSSLSSSAHGIPAATLFSLARRDRSSHREVIMKGDILRLETLETLKRHAGNVHAIVMPQRTW